MTALPNADAQAWFATVRTQLKNQPKSVPGPEAYGGAPVSVAYDGARCAILSGFHEEAHEQIMIDIEVAPGVVAALDELRITY